MEVMSMPRVQVVDRLRERAEAMQGRSEDPSYTRYQADLMESLPGDTLGESLHHAQLEHRKLLRTRHRCLAGGLTLFGVAFVNAIGHASGPLGPVGFPLMLGSTLGGCFLVARGGITGDKIHRSETNLSALSHCAQTLRYEGGTSRADAELARKFGQTDRSRPHTRAELVELLETVESSLQQRAGEPGVAGALVQVQEDLEQIRSARGEDLPAMVAAVRERSAHLRKISGGLLLGAGTAMLGVMFTGKLLPAAGIASSLLMCGLAGAGIVLQDRADSVLQLQDTLERWQLNLTDLKESGRMAGGSGPGGNLQVKEGAVVVGGVRVKVKVRPEG